MGVSPCPAASIPKQLKKWAFGQRESHPFCGCHFTLDVIVSRWQYINYLFLIELRYN